MTRVFVLVVASLAVAVAAASRWDPLAQKFAARAFMMGVLLAGVIPFIVAWHRQARRAGTPLLDFGWPGTTPSGGFIPLLALYGIESIVAAVFKAHTGPARTAGWLGALLVSAAIHWAVLMRRRGLSLRDGGVLTPCDLVAWDEIFFWSCHRDGGTLVLGVRGVGWMQSLATGKPASDTMQTWRVPADLFEAAEAILVQRARYARG